MPTPTRSILGLLLALIAPFSFAADLTSLPYGITRKGTALTAAIDPRLTDVSHSATRVLVIAKAERSPEAQAPTTALLSQIRSAAETWHARYPGIAISLIETPYPESLTEWPAYPPGGRAYDATVNPEAIYLWRWVGMLAPDVVVEVGASAMTAWSIPASDRVDLAFARSLPNPTPAVADGLAAALVSHAPCDVAPIPALALNATASADLEPLLHLLQAKPIRSPAREELLQRRSRSPLEVAQSLAQIYGQQFNEVAYIPALPLIGRLRLGELTSDPSHRAEVERLVAPFVSGEKPSLPVPSNGSQQAGHLLFGELATRTRDPRLLALVLAPAALGFDAQGQPLPVMPAHAEMSDAVFLGTPLLAQAARLSGDARFRDLALRHLHFMVQLNRRPDGLHRHSPVAPEQTAWGRGNGFVALGLALTLSEWPEDDPAFAELLAVLREHLEAMLPHQDELGMWHQVVDVPASYREYTVTAMTTFALTRAVRRGWLDRARIEPVVQRAWTSLAQRTASDGRFVDVCTGTGKMKSLREYLDRPSILGRDERGAGMALLLCTELAFAQREGVLSLP